MYIFKIPHFCNNKCISHSSKLYERPPGCQLSGTRQLSRKPISTSLLGRFLHNISLAAEYNDAAQVHHVLHDTQEASFLRLCAIFTDRGRRPEASRWVAPVAFPAHINSARTESRLETHDLAIPLSAPTNTNTKYVKPTRELRVLLLAPSWTLEAALPNTLDRIHHFASLTGGQGLAIVFLLNTPKTCSFISVKDLTSTESDPEVGTTGVLAYAKLQASLFSRSDIPHIPIFPLASVDVLQGLLLKTIAANSRKPQKTPASTTPFGMLQLSTTEPPMDRQTSYFATDCFADLRELAVTCTEPAAELTSTLPSFDMGGNSFSQSSAGEQGGYVGTASQRHGTEAGLRQLRGLVGEERYPELVEFWLDEWVVE